MRLVCWRKPGTFVTNLIFLKVRAVKYSGPCLVTGFSWNIEPSEPQLLQKPSKGISSISNNHQPTIMLYLHNLWTKIVFLGNIRYLIVEVQLKVRICNFTDLGLPFEKTWPLLTEWVCE